jgi:deoxycytidine triphosphate deaminase
MKRLIIVTGAAGSGKSSVAAQLVTQGLVHQLRTFAIKPKAPVNAVECEAITRTPSAGRIAWVGERDGVQYGMQTSEIDGIPSGSLGLAVADPALLPQIAAFRTAHPEMEVIIIGLDTIQTPADQAARLNNAGHGDTAIRLAEIRTLLAGTDVRLDGNEAQVINAVQAVCRLLQSRGGLLTRDLLEPLVAAGAVLTNSSAASFKSASYDLRVGDEAWCHGFIDLTANDPIFVIPPYSYAIVKAMERAALPTLMIGQFDLRVSYFLSGIILSNGPQVDPGYRGDLFCMLFNGNSEPKELRMGDRFCTIQFTSTVRVSEPYAGEYSIRAKLRASMPPRAAVGPGGAIFSKLSSDIEAAKRELRTEFPKDRAGLNIGLIGILAAISIPITFWTWSVTIDATKAIADANKAAADARAAASAAGSNQVLLNGTPNDRSNTTSAAAPSAIATPASPPNVQLQAGGTPANDSNRTSK